MEIGKLIKEKRIEKNLTQEALAQEFFVTRQLISKWENGKSYPDLDQAVKLSDYFGISLDELLRGDTAMRKELQFDGKRKKWFKFLLILLSHIVFVCIVFIISLWKSNPTFLSKKDINVMKVEKKILPQEKVVNQKTGETITLPQDVEYTIYFTTKLPFVNLNSISGMQIDDDSGTIICQVYSERVLWGGNKKSKLVIRSNRKYDYLKSDLNLGKDIYIYNNDKSRKLHQASLKKVSDQLYSSEELDRMKTGTNK